MTLIVSPPDPALRVIGDRISIRTHVSRIVEVKNVCEREWCTKEQQLAAKHAVHRTSFTYIDRVDTGIAIDGERRPGFCLNINHIAAFVRVNGKRSDRSRYIRKINGDVIGGITTNYSVARVYGQCTLVIKLDRFEGIDRDLQTGSNRTVRKADNVCRIR